MSETSASLDLLVTGIACVCKYFVIVQPSSQWSPPLGLIRQSSPNLDLHSSFIFICCMPSKQYVVYVHLLNPLGQLSQRLSMVRYIGTTTKIWTQWDSNPVLTSILQLAGEHETYLLTLKVLNFWYSLGNVVSGSLDSYCILKPLWSGMGEVVPARTSPTLHPPSPPTAL